MLCLIGSMVARPTAKREVGSEGVLGRTVLKSLELCSVNGNKLSNSNSFIV